jgi:hypothetical protein
MLTKIQVQELFHYDINTGTITRKKDGKIYSKLSNQCYIKIRIGTKEYAAHRLAWLYVYGSFPEHDIDHINGIRNDNRIHNLRPATRSQNCHNQKKKHKNNSTGFMGVDYHKASNKYRARIRLHNKEIHLGLFDSAEISHKNYVEAKRKLHPYSTI